MKKKITAVILTALLGLSAFSFTACTPREETLKICTWEAYTDESYVKKEFPKYFASKTNGKKVKVKISNFTNNEDLYEEIATNRMDYDLICPSDYLVEKLIKDDMLIALDKDIISGYDTLLETDILEKVKIFDAEKKYTFPYAWGTFGIMYNTSKAVDAADMQSWNALWNKKPDGTAAAYNKKIYMKDSARDAFTVANLYNNGAALKNTSENYTNYDAPAYQTLLNKMFDIPDQDMLDSAKQSLIDQRRVFFNYESEDGKDALASNTNDAYLGLFWSCDAGYAMQNNNYLRYSVPKEGANFYVDCFVIPKYAKNVEAAQHFLAFLTGEDAAYANTMMSGATGTVKSANERIYNELLTMNTGFMKNATADFRENYIYMVMFPEKNTKDTEIMKRCAIMRDYEDKNSAVTRLLIAAQSAAL